VNCPHCKRIFSADESSLAYTGARVEFCPYCGVKLGGGMTHYWKTIEYENELSEVRLYCNGKEVTAIDPSFALYHKFCPCCGQRLEAEG
jgi:rRNA maturation endonuclease Nob1